MQEPTDLAWWIGGCRNVINRLRVEPAERDGDDDGWQHME